MPVAVLGPLEASNRQGVPLAGMSVHQRRLLAALVMHSERTISAEQLVLMVWQDHEIPAFGVKALQTRVSRLRAALADAAVDIRTQNNGYRLDGDGDALDVIHFEELIAQAKAVDDPVETVRRFDRALELWRGRPFEDVADFEWARPEVGRLEEVHADAIEHRFKALLASGRHTEAVGPLRDAVETSPWRDRRRVQLALALYRAGRQTEALRSIDQYRRALRDETGLELGGELRSLEDRILRQDPDLDLEVAPRTLRGVEFIQQIGEGAMAVVWRANQPGLDRSVAVKVIRTELADNADFIRRFEVEAQTIARLEHPNIVPLYDYWREPGGAYLLMRLMRGGSLEERLGSAPLDAERLERFCWQIGDALRTAHRAGISHGDIKAANVLLDERGNFFLSDFGIASAVDSRNGVGISIGSPGYAPPEVLTGGVGDVRSDIYSFGITLYEAATGKLPFQAGSAAELVGRHLTQPTPRPSDAVDTPSWVDDVVDRATQKVPADRFGSIGELLNLVPDLGRSHENGDAPDTFRNPFKGLKAFTESDAEDFFGRSELVESLVEKFEAGRFVAVVGPSGSGKSSVVRAGLIPALRRGAIAGSERWFVTSMTPGSDPFRSLGDALARVVTSQAGSIETLLRSGPDGLRRAVSDCIDGNLVLVVDQFEELFTLAEDDADRIMDALVEAVEHHDSKVRIVVTVRADFWDRPLSHAGFVAAVLDQVAIVGALRPEQLEAAITQGVTAQGMRFETGLVSRLVSDAEGQAGALPLLQFVLAELFDRRTGKVMTLDSYVDMGGISGALGRRAETEYLSSQSEVQTATRRLFRRLARVGEAAEVTGQRIDRDQLGMGRPIEECIERFSKARLLTLDRDPASRAPTVEIAHEALFREWPRLAAWVAEDRDGLRVHRRLTNAATEWRSAGRGADHLYTGGRLDSAVEYKRQWPGSLSSVEDEFVSASLAADADRISVETRRTLTLKGLLAGAVVLLAVATVAGTLAFQQRGDAREAEAAAEANAASALEAQEDALVSAGRAEEAQLLAETQRFAAETSRLEASAIAAAESDPQLAHLLAMEAYRRSPTPETLGTIQRVAIRTVGPTQHMGSPENRYRDVRWVGDETIVAVHVDGIQAFSAQTSEVLWSLALDVRVERGNREPAEGGIVAFDTTSDGAYAAVAATGGPVHLVEIASGVTTVLPHTAPVTALAFSPGSDSLVTGDTNGTLRSWSLPTGEQVAEVDAHPEQPVEFAERVRQEGGSIDFIGQSVVPNSYIYRGVTRMTFSLDGDDLVTTEFPIVRIWDAATLEPRSEFIPLYDRGPGVELLGLPRIAPPDAVDSLFQFDPADNGTIWLSNGTYLLRYDVTSGALVESSSVQTGIEGSPAGSPGLVRGSGFWINYMGDGRIVRVDDGGDVVELAAPGFLGSSALQIDQAQSRLVGAADGAVFVLSLHRGSSLSTGVERLGGSFVSITADGGLVAESDDPEGPTHYYRRVGHYYDPAVPVEPIASSSAEVKSLSPGADVAVVFDWSDKTFSGASMFVDAESPEDPVRSTGVSSIDPAVHPNGRWIFLFPEWLGSDLNPRIWDLETQTEVVKLSPFPIPEGWAFFRKSASFSADGSKVIATTVDGVYRIWNTSDWSLLDDEQALGNVSVASFDPTGALLATIDLDNVITMRDAKTYEEIWQAAAPGSNGLFGGGMGWNSDGRYLLVAIGDSPSLWDVATGIRLGDPFPSTQDSTPGSSSGEVLQLVTARPNTLDVWNLDPESWPAAACKAAGRNLTQAEWDRIGPRDSAYRRTCPQFDAANGSG